MIVCSLRSNDKAFAKKFREKHSEYAKVFSEDALAAIVSYYVSSMGELASYNDENFLQYFNRLLNQKVNEEDFSMFVGMLNAFKELGGKEVLEYKEGSEVEDFVNQFSSLFEVFKDEKTKTKYAVLKKFELNKEEKTLQEKALDRINTLAQKKVVKKGRKDPQTGRTLYEYDGKEIEAISVSTDIYGPSMDNSNIPALAGPMGTLVDFIVRDFFDEESDLFKVINSDKIDEDDLENIIAKRYGKNITPQGVMNLVSDLRRVQKLFEEKFGEGYKVISKSITLFAQNSKTGEWLTGIPDLLIVDKQGTVHVVDIKGKMADYGAGKYKTNVYRSAEAYGGQLTRYIKMLQANGLKVADNPTLLLAETYGSHISNKTNEETPVVSVERLPEHEYGTRAPKITVAETNQSLEDYVKKNGNNSEDYLYREPRIHFPEDSSPETRVDTLHDLEFDKEGLPNYQGVENSNDNALLNEMLGKPQQTQRTYSSPIVTMSSNDIFSNPELIGAAEIYFLANSVMSEVSEIIDIIKEDGSYDELGEGFEEILKGKSSQEIIDFLGIDTIIDKVLDDHFDTDTTELEREDFNSEEDYLHWQKTQWLWAHREQLKELGYAKLLSLESSVTLQKADRTDNDYTADLGDNEALQAVADRAAEEMDDREAWMLGERHFSPKASLAQELKRLFERCFNKDENNKPIMDKYGWDFKTYVDSTTAVSSILEWCSNCDTLEEMMEVLEKQAKYNNNYWLTDVIDKLNSDKNLQKKFFKHFRKDSTKYSIVRASYVDGRMVLRTEIINTKSAYETMMQSVTKSFNDHRVGKLFDSKGRVNTLYLENLKKEFDKISNDISRIYQSARGDNLEEQIWDGFERDNIVNRVTQALNDIGILVPEDVVRNVMANTLKGKNTNGAALLMTRAYSVLNMIGHKNYQGKTDVNPMKKGASPSVFPLYKNLITQLGDAVQAHVEASVYNDGKTYYSYSNPSYLMHQIKNLKDAMRDKDKFNSFLHKEFDIYKGWFIDSEGHYLNDWVDSLESSDYAREVLDHKVQLSYMGSEYKNLGALGYHLSILTEYFGSKDDPEGTHWYALPTMSNKPTSEFVRFTGYHSKFEVFDRVLFPTFIQETNRMVDVLETFLNKATKTDQIDLTVKKLKQEGGFTEEEIDELRNNIANGTLTVNDMFRLSKITSGAKFHFLYYLNNEMAKSDSKIAELMVKKINSLLKGEEFEESLDLVQNMRETLIGNFKEGTPGLVGEIVEQEIEIMEKAGLFETKKVKQPDGSVKEVLKYQERFGRNLVFNAKEPLEANKRRMKEALEKFVWDDIAANINIIQITGGDLAYYGNSVNYQKRIAQIHSPGLHLCSEKNDPDGVDDGFLRSVHIADEHAVSEVTQNAIAALEEYKKTLPKSQQEEFGKMIKVIAAGFQDINVTDGQSFSCPTSYKKKLELQGEWTDEMQKAYDRIREGNFDLNDLGVMWGPTKPFVTAQIPKYSGSSTMVFRKKPLQDKNSEYMLLLAEALAFQAGKDSKMTAIYDWMESTHWSEYDFKNHKPAKGATYKRNGIDTVHFESVGKVGLSGVVDFSEQTHGEHLTNDEVIELLNESTKYNGEAREGNALYRSIVDRSGRLYGVGDIFDTDYNDAYVDKVPVENYIIQQEVPAHLLEHEQLYGSQSRILGVSDITPGTQFQVGNETMSDKDLVSEYKELHATNIRESFEDLMDELGIPKGYKDESNPTVEERNARLEKLEAILKKEILKDGKYGADLLRACSLVTVDDLGNKDFRIPLGDPIQSSRIQMLLNSIIKKSINKQKIKGGPVVQATVYDEDLHIVFKGKDGKPLAKTRKDFAEGEQGDREYKKYIDENQDGIAYYECYLPVPNAELEKLMINPDGSMMSIEELKEIMGEEAWNALSQVIGYRIPTEDKYSMLPLKIKGFMPKAAGQAIMMPKEITYLTGSDFDIDKMYLMLKSFSEKRVPTNELVKALKNQSNGRYNEIFQDLDVYNILERLQLGQPAPGYTTDKRVRDLVDWYRKTTIKAMFQEYKDRNTKNRKANREARNNRLLDLQWSVLTNKDTASKMMNPGNFDAQKKTGRAIRILKAQAQDKSIKNPKTGKPWTLNELKALYDEKGARALDNILENADIHSVTLPSNKVYFQQQNMQGTQMVGIFANHNASHAFLSFQKVGIDLTKGGKDRSFWFNGVEIGNPNNMLVLDALTGHDGKLISKTIAEFLAASVDTAKDPTLRDLNVNTFTGTVAMTLARLGFDTESIGLFLSQPIIQEVSDLYFRRSNEGFYQGSSAIKEVWGSLFEGRVDRKELERTAYLDANSITKENLIESLGTSLERDSEGNLIAKSQDDIDFQKKVLIAFNALYGMATDINDITFCTKFNSVSNAVGPTIAATSEKYQKYNDFITKVIDGKTCFYIPTSDKEIYTNPGEVVNNDPILQAFFECTYGENGASRKIFEEYFPHYLPGFQSILTTFREQYVKSGKVNEKLYNQLLNDYMFYMLTYDNPLDGISATLPSGKEEMNYYVKSLVSRFDRIAKKKDREPNIILDQGLGNNCLRVRAKDPFIAMDTLVFYGGQLNAENREEVKAAWGDMMTSTDPEIRALGIDLFYYTLLRNGFGFSPKTLMHLASVNVRQNAQGSRKVLDRSTGEMVDRPYTNYVDGVRNFKTIDAVLMQDPTKVHDFIKMFIRNHSNNQALVPIVQVSDDIVNFTDITSTDITLSASEKEDYKLGRFIKDNSALPFITVAAKIGGQTRTVLYELDTKRMETGMEKKGDTFYLYYKEVNKLGLTNNFLEYNANNNLENSYFDEIRGESEADTEVEEPTKDTGASTEVITSTEKDEISEDDPMWEQTDKLSRIVKKHSPKSKTKKGFQDLFRNYRNDKEQLREKVSEFLSDQGLEEAEKEVMEFLEKEDLC